MKYPYIKFYVRDWISDAQLRMVTLASRGLWIECLCIMQMASRRGYLETSKGVAISDEMLARLTGTFKDDLYRSKQELLDNGIPSVEQETGVWYCRRMVNEVSKAEKCSEAGRLGGGNPALKKENSQKPETRTHISLKDTFKGEVKGQFEEFWKEYPKKEGKKKAESAFVKAMKVATVETVTIGLRKFVTSDGWTKDGGQFIPHAATWLNGERWNDEPMKTQLRNPSTPAFTGNNLPL